MGLIDSPDEWAAQGPLIDRPKPFRVAKDTAFRTIPDQ